MLGRLLMNVKKIVCLIAALLVYILQISAQSELVELPYSWIEDTIKITIYGIFHSDDKTKEGSIGKQEEQYKVLIGYENTLSKTYNYQSSFSKSIPGVGFLRIETLSGNIYDPKYVGGSIVFSSLKPNYKYITHNYAFNVHKGELPIKLHKYDKKKSEQPFVVINLKSLISPPVPESTRSIKIGDIIRTEYFTYQPLSYAEVKYLIKGPFQRTSYGMYEPKKGYKFVILKFEIVNVGTQRRDVRLYSGDGEFKVKVDKGYTYNVISPYLYYISRSERWFKPASISDRQKYPCVRDFAPSLNPEESITLVKAFEILSNTNPIEFSCRLLGDVEEVIINIEQ